MVVMALVTTIMTGPLLNVIYPRRLVDHDIAEVARAALGAADVRRVLAVSTGEDVDASTLAVASALAARHRPTEVVLSRLLPYQRRSIEVGSGLTGELMEMTNAMAALERLAGPARTDDVAVRVLTGFTSEPGRDFLAQVDTVDPVVFVVPVSLEVPGDLPVETVTVRRPLPESPGRSPSVSAATTTRRSAPARCWPAADPSTSTGGPAGGCPRWSRSWSRRASRCAAATAAASWSTATTPTCRYAASPTGCRPSRTSGWPGSARPH